MRALQSTAVLVALIALTVPARAGDDLDALARAIDASPDDARTYDAYATAALRQKRWDDAIRKLKIGVARIPDYAEGYYKLGYAFRQKREWADAADYYRRYVTLNPSRTDTWFGLGAALEGLGDKQGAIAAYEKYVALEKSPQKQRFVDEARAELAKLEPARVPGPPPSVTASPPSVTAPPPSVTAPPPSVTAPPTVTPPSVTAPTVASATVTPPPARADAAALRAEADRLRQAGKLPEAAAAYQRAIDADRGNLDLYNDLGNVYFALKRYGDAATAFADATRRDPRYALGWYNLAHALRKADRPREAADAYRRYITLKPDDPDPYYGLGQTLKMMGDAAGAIAAFKKYIAMEKRPDEQRWVDKARAELQALEAMQAPHGPSGKIDDKSSDNAEARLERDRELGRDALLPPSDDDMRLIDPFDRPGARLHDLKNPFGGDEEIIDPFAPNAAVATANDKLRRYGAALAAYRRALSRQVDDVALRYERGVAAVLASNATSALRAWNGVALDDPDVTAARQSVERIRKSLAASH